MPAKHPDEFRENVAHVASNRESNATLAQIARDFGFQIGTLDEWMRHARIESGEQRELTKRNRLSE